MTNVKWSDNTQFPITSPDNGYMMGLQGGANVKYPLFGPWPGIIGVLGFLKAIDINSTGDKIIPITAVGSYIVLDVLISNPSTAIAGFPSGDLYSAAAAGGFRITRSLLDNIGGSVLTNATDFFDQAWSAPTSGVGSAAMTYQVSASGTVLTSSNLFLNVTSANGSPATIDIYVLGLVLL